MAHESVRTAGRLAADPPDPVEASVEDLTTKFGAASDISAPDAIAYVAADLHRRDVDPAVWREMSAHELLDLVEVPRAGSFLPYSLNERLAVCARKAAVPTPAEVPPAEPQPVAEAAAAVAVAPVAVADVLSGVQAELAALRAVIESLGTELRERLEAVHEEVLTAKGVLDPGPAAAPSATPTAEPQAAPVEAVPRRGLGRRAALIAVLVVVGAAVVTGLVVLVYGWDELRSDLTGFLALLHSARSREGAWL